MKIIKVFYSLIVLLPTLVLSSCFLFNDDNPLEIAPEISDPCSIVHETYPNVGEDSCAWVLNVIENYPPPIVLPPATDTGGRLLAARIVTDTGEFIFVAGGVPARFLSTPCDWWRTRDSNNDGNILIGGNYCDRPPVDDRSMQLTFWLNKFGQFYTPLNGPLFSLRLDNDLVYTQTDTTALNFILTRIDQDARILSGNFSSILFNRNDATDSIRIVDGRFDIKY